MLEDLFEDLPQVSVSQYTAAIKKALEGKIPPCWILGEVSNFRRQASGHLYFSLKDVGSQLPAVMFRGQAASLKFVPRDGMQVLVFGEISVYEPHGKYQLIVRQMQESGEGRLFREFERLKRKLAEEGLFDAEKKRRLPSLPLRVAIVTSPTGAALQDFMRILKRRGWKGLLHIFPAKVQGQGAAEEIEQNIRNVNEIGGYDLVVVARGGGSIEDLWAFNEERVARAVARSDIPVLSGVGHEIDFTLSDFAADVRAETPSGAAELISSAYIEALDKLELMRDDMGSICWERLRDCTVSLDRLKRDLRNQSPAAVLEKSFLRIDELGTRLESLFKESLREGQSRLDGLERRLIRVDVASTLKASRESLMRHSRSLEVGWSQQLVDLRGRLRILEATLGALSPQATLKRGFAIIETREGRAIGSVESAREGDKLRARLGDGCLDVEVERIEKREA